MRWDASFFQTANRAPALHSGETFSHICRGESTMKPNLRFRHDGSFTLVQFTDTHFENGEPEDIRTSALMDRILDTEQPDLVIFTGDVLGAGVQNSDVAWRRAAHPMIQRSIPWASVFGNHDDESGTASHAELMAIQQSLPGCLTQPGPRSLSGLGNFLLRVTSSRTVDTAAALCCLNSNSYAKSSIGGYDWIHQDQIRWFKRALQRLPPDQQSQTSPHLPVLVFFHIPLPEFDEVWRMGHCTGEKHEDVCCPRINTGFFAAAHLSGRVHGIFCGHDHVNDYQGRLHDIRLCYGRASGYNAYGREGFARGARVIRLHEDGRDFDTWLRLEDGSKAVQ